MLKRRVLVIICERDCQLRFFVQNYYILYDIHLHLLNSNSKYIPEWVSKKKSSNSDSIRPFPMYVCQYVPWVLVKSFPFMRSLSLCQYFPFQSSHLISTPSNNVWEINLSMYSSYGRNKRKFSSFLTIVFGSLKASESIFIAWTCTIKKMRQNRTKRKQITKCK